MMIHCLGGSEVIRLSSVPEKRKRYDFKSEKQKKDVLIFTCPGRYHDHKCVFFRLGLIHCISDVLTPAIFPNVGNSTV